MAVTELLEKDLNKLLLRDQTFIPLWQRLNWAKQAITGYHVVSCRIVSCCIVMPCHHVLLHWM
jgi:hypothetical protein